MKITSLHELPLYKRHMTDGVGERSTIDDYDELQRRALLTGIDSNQSMGQLIVRVED